jgi:two-component system sensor histidine kinase YesM
MKSKIIANRVMVIMGIYTFWTLLLWLYALVFFVEFQNTMNMLMLFIVSVGAVAMPVLVYYHVLLPTRYLNRNIKRFKENQSLEGLLLSNTLFTTEMADMFEYVTNMSENMQSIKLSKFQSEYRALQNQINPHFLYNTLEAIRSDALVANQQEIADITEALATFFRYTISNVDDLVTLEDELNNANNYFKIQNYRFNDRITLNVNNHGSDKLLKMAIPKLTLQPIVENSIIHGLERKVEKGTVTINISDTQEKVIIDVMDDGVGIDDETLESMNDRLHQLSNSQLEEKLSKGGIALLNVNNRFKMTFGEAYGLKVSSVKDYGTTVNITFPKEQ